jgi:Fur family transcriptional regulator, ferric uptake regulator
MAEDQVARRAPKYGETQQIIAEIVKNLPKGEHLTAPEVYERTKDFGVDISLSTVYRALHRLKSHGNVSTVSGERGLRYETAEEGGDHDHLICLGCGTTIEFVDELIRGFGKSVAERKGFEHSWSRFDILGYCSECSANDSGNRIQQSIDHVTAALEGIEESAGQLRQAIELHESRKLSRGHALVQSATDKMRKALADCESSLTLLNKESVS